MGPLFASTVIDAPRERVFAFLADLANRPSFCDHFQLDYRLERLDSDGVGAAARFRVEAPRNHVWADSAIDKLESPHLISEHGRCGRWNRVPARTVWELVEGPGSSITIRLAFWTSPTHPLDLVRERLGAARWYRRQLERALERLREAVESESPQHARLVTAGG
jgi:uncharacterized protein YndB with AHSA1/START domain